MSSVIYLYKEQSKPVVEGMTYSAIVEKYVKLDDTAIRLEKIGAYGFAVKLRNELMQADQWISASFNPSLEMAEYHLKRADWIVEDARKQYGNRL